MLPLALLLASAPPEATAADLKTTAVALTARMREDNSDKLWLAYLGREVELTGRVRDAEETGEGPNRRWYVSVLGCPGKDPWLPCRVSLPFPADGPDAARIRNLSVGDAVAVRGTSAIFTGVVLHVENPTLVKGGERPPAPVKPARRATAEAFVQELLADRAAAERYFGTAVELTGTVHGSVGPRGASYPLSLSAASARPRTRSWTSPIVASTTTSCSPCNSCPRD